LETRILVPALFIAPVLGLIFVEPDRGTAILLAAVSAAVLLIAGVQWKYFIPPLVLGIVALGISLWHDPMRIKRIMAWVYLEETQERRRLSGYQAMLALGFGRLVRAGAGKRPAETRLRAGSTTAISSFRSIGEEWS